jgi:hypothetical protein
MNHPLLHRHNAVVLASLAVLLMTLVALRLCLGPDPSPYTTDQQKLYGSWNETDALAAVTAQFAYPAEANTGSSNSTNSATYTVLASGTLRPEQTEASVQGTSPVVHKYVGLEERPSVATVNQHQEAVHQRRQHLQGRLDRLDWSKYNFEQGELSDAFLRDYYNALLPYLDAQPLAPVTVASRPVPLVDSLDCASPDFVARGVTGGSMRSKPARVFDVFPFSYELDVLEMRLYELNDTVDYFVLIESTRTHRGTLKPLGFARNEVCGAWTI